MKQYLAQLTEILKDGEVRTDRTGTGTKSIFGMQTRYNLRDGFPAVTTKKLAWRSVVSELLWFLEGSTDERRLCEILHGARDPEKSTIWSANALNQGVALGYTYNDTQRQLGPVYGAQWRDWGSDASRSGEHTDQITSLINQLRHQPHSRRHILSAWNVGDVPDMALPPCHVMAQFYVSNNDELSCQLYQRSADMFLGVPFNIASYALLTHILAQLTGLKVGDFVHTIGDAHIYLNHIDQVKLQLERPTMELPNIIMPSFTTLDELTSLPVDAFKLMGYNPHATIKAPMAV
jgi:thymidylate synthase